MPAAIAGVTRKAHMEGRRGSGFSSPCVSRRPILAQHFRLPQYRDGRLLLSVGRVAVLLQDALHHYANLRPYRLLNGPVDPGILAHSVYKLACDLDRKSTRLNSSH